MNHITTNACVSISEFSRGNTAKIFRELEKYERITVLKNNRPIGILVSPNTNHTTTNDSS